MLLIRDIKVAIEKDPGVEKAFLKAQKKARGLLRAGASEGSFSLIHCSLDARKKPLLFWNLTLGFSSDKEDRLLRACRDKRVGKDDRIRYRPPGPAVSAAIAAPVIVGMGPAGLFAAKLLLEAGIRPVILERGAPVEERIKAVEAFWRGEGLKTGSNVQFGEGGAGTFSDGKLNTGNKDREGRYRWILESFVEYGASRDILWDQRPHLGSDQLLLILKRFREDLLDRGAVIHYHTRLEDIRRSEEGGYSLYAVKEDKPDEGLILKTENLFLGLGHSAADTFSMLEKNGFSLEKKAFAIGLRVEHPQSLINAAQYGEAFPEGLPPAVYQLRGKGVKGRPVFSFCMCPGGYVVNASSEADGMVVNGMSYRNRDGKNANSAIVLSVTPEEVTGSGALSGLHWRKELEKKAFALGKGRIPSCSLGEFRAKKLLDTEPDEEAFSHKGATVKAPLWELFTEPLYQDFLKGMDDFGRKLKGFDSPDTILSAIESRTSCPLRILRDPESLEAPGWPGIYPMGEGAGYAGGIISSAADGMRAAESMVKSLLNRM